MSKQTSVKTKYFKNPGFSAIEQPKISIYTVRYMQIYIIQNTTKYKYELYSFAMMME